MAKKRGNPNWKKGVSGNPKGKKTSPTQALERAIKTVEKNRRQKLLEHFVKRAFISDAVLVALLKKVFPDLKHVEGRTDSPTRIILERSDGTKGTADSENNR